ncbi:MAG: class I SAM-dependent methyltransferase [Acidobacteria bacterium]|nr:class I SAM-dependent methyltransferase [Acidobacteriota bacterium]
MTNDSPTDGRRAARAERIAALGYAYADQPTSPIPACNLCGHAGFVVVTHRDRYGYPARAMGCRRCGLVFLNPQMTADAYKRFYVSAYRPLVSAYHGRVIDAKSIQAEQRSYAVERGEFLDPFLRDAGYATLLDIGGSTGVVSHAWTTRFGLNGTVIDPSPLEIEEARALGLDTVTAIIEDWDAGGRVFDTVVMCQTVDHLLDIRGTFAAVRRLLRPDGVFFVDIVDFRAAYLRNWSVEEAIKIDHPYYLTDATMTAYLRRAGFDVLRTDYAADHLLVGYVCRPCVPATDSLPDPASVATLLDEARLVQNAPRGGR